jgi:hypothetical protein
VKGDLAQGVGDGGEVPRRVVGEGGGAVEGVGLAERVVEAVVGEGGGLVQRVGDGEDVALAVVGVGGSSGSSSLLLTNASINTQRLSKFSSPFIGHPI